MVAIWVMLISICTLCDQTAPIEAEPDVHLDSMEVVATVRIESISKRDHVIFGEGIKVFKGTVGRTFVISEPHDFRFEVDSVYLLYAKVYRDMFFLGEKTKTKLLTSASEDIQFFNKNFPCKTSPPEKYGACERNTSPVCGCDGITYGSSCEAAKKGVLIYTFGACSD